MARPSMTMPLADGRNNWTIKLEIDEVGSALSCQPIPPDGEPPIPFQSRGPRGTGPTTAQLSSSPSPGPFSVAIEQIFEDDPLFFAGTDGTAESMMGPSASKSGDLSRLSARSVDRKEKTKDVEESIHSLLAPSIQSKDDLKKKRSSKKHKAVPRPAIKKQSPNARSKPTPQPARTTKSKLGGKRKSPQKTQRKYEDSNDDLSTGGSSWKGSKPSSRVTSFQSSKGSKPNSRFGSFGEESTFQTNGQPSFQNLPNTSTSMYANPSAFNVEKASANFAESHTALASNIRDLEENLRRITLEYNQLKKEFEEQKMCMASVCAERDKNGRAVAELSQIISSNENAQHNLLSVIQDMKDKMESLEKRGLLAPITSAPYALDLASQVGTFGSGPKCPTGLGNPRKGPDTELATQLSKTFSGQKIQKDLSKTFSGQKIQKDLSKTFSGQKIQKDLSKTFSGQKIQKEKDPSKTFGGQKIQIQKAPSNSKFKKSESSSKIKKVPSKPKVKLPLKRK